MPYVGGRLEPLFDSGPTRATLIRLARRGGDRMVEWTIRNTPIGGRFEGSGRGGNLRSSWYQRPLRRTRRGPWRGWESGVATDVDYAPHVEYGTGLWGPKHRKYLIVPKKPGGWLHWIDPRTGKDVFARRVMHPGSPGQHMVAIAATMVEHEFDRYVDDIMAEWVHAQESLFNQ